MEYLVRFINNDELVRESQGIFSRNKVATMVELWRIFDVCKRWAKSSFACICKQKYSSIHEATRAIRSLLVWNTVLASCIEIYYFVIDIFLHCFF